MKVLILAGGLGTRLMEETQVKPKPMVEIGGTPILCHIMNIYSGFGYKEFVVASGYKGEIISDYFLNYRYLNNNLTVNLSDGHVEVHNSGKHDWLVHIIDTGLETLTGGRIKRLASWIENDTFMMTYGDAVSDVNIQELVEFHRSHGKAATITAVRPPARFGGLNLEGDVVTEFNEKPQVGEGWINGGFFVFEPSVLDYIGNKDVYFEREPLERLAQAGELMAFRHQSFWQCMDTLRDVRLLEELCSSEAPPWNIP